MTQKTIRGSKYEYLIWFFEMLNMLLKDKLSNREIELLAEFLKLREDKYRYSPFFTEAKTRVLKDLKERGIGMSRQNMHNKLSSLRKKSIIFVEDDGMMRLNPQIKKALERGLSTGKFEISFIYLIDDSSEQHTGQNNADDSQESES